MVWHKVVCDSGFADRKCLHHVALLSNHAKNRDSFGLLRDRTFVLDMCVFPICYLCMVGLKLDAASWCHTILPCAVMSAMPPTRRYAFEESEQFCQSKVPTKCWMRFIVSWCAKTCWACSRHSRAWRCSQSFSKLKFAVFLTLDVGLTLRTICGCSGPSKQRRKFRTHRCGAGHFCADERPKVLSGTRTGWHVAGIFFPDWSLRVT